MKELKNGKDTSSKGHDYHLGPRREEKKVSGENRGRGFKNLAKLIPRKRTRSSSLPPLDRDSTPPPPSKVLIKSTTDVTGGGGGGGGENNCTNSEKTLGRSASTPSSIACPNCREFFDASKIIESFLDELKNKAAKPTEAGPNTPPLKASKPGRAGH